MLGRSRHVSATQAGGGCTSRGSRPGWAGTWVRGSLLLAVALVLVAAGCNGDAPPAEDTGVDEVAAAQDIQARFLENLSVHCGEAFPGRLAVAPVGDEMLTGTEELLVHFRDCEADEVRIPFHVEVEETESWDSSRTWYVMRVADGLELRHDHREDDGSEDDRTWYGGFSMDTGTPNRQDFSSPERTEAAGVPVGWRIQIEPGVVYRYGTIREGEYTWMVEFDLSQAIEGEIPDAWGHDEPPSRIPGPP